MYGNAHFLQYRNPIASPLGPPPASRIIPIRIKPIMAITLINENQNSISPYTLTPKKLVLQTHTRPIAIQTPVEEHDQIALEWGMCGYEPLLIVTFQ
jgi:hypothetical protein